MDGLEISHAELIERVITRMRVAGRDEGLGPVVPHLTRNLDFAARKIRLICAGTKKVFASEEVRAVQQAAHNIGKASFEGAHNISDALGELAQLMENQLV